MIAHPRERVIPAQTHPAQINPPHTIKALLSLWLLLMMSAPATVASEQSLEGVIEDHWQWVLQQYPERRLEYGDRSGNGQ
ncbi:MAG: hypothetical protein VW664_07535, partial [Halieaceae bacterium]